jgi:hypothetical protein
LHSTSFNPSSDSGDSLVEAIRYVFPPVRFQPFLRFWRRAIRGINYPTPEVSTLLEILGLVYSVVVGF